MNSPLVRIGLPKTVGALPGAAFNIGAELDLDGLPVLVSANSLWDHKRGYFREPGFAICDLDVALDSAGFVALARYGRYPWGVPEYVALAHSWSWSWWAQMDLCCEPEIAADAATVRARVEGTATLLHLCRMWAAHYRGLFVEGVQPEIRAAMGARCPDPMPILQGWRPEDYARSVQLTDAVLGGRWPSMVGLGSVCRRNLGGADGLRAILARIDRELPPGVGLHLFGVKGAILREIADHPRVVSMDSAAWAMEARQRARKAGVSCTNTLKAEVMREWYTAQTRPAPARPQLSLFTQGA